MVRTARDVLLPLFVFPTLSSLATTYIFGHLFDSGLADTLGARCPTILPPNATQDYPSRLKYTGFDSFDGRFCGIVEFFQYAIAPSDTEPLPRLFTGYFMGTALPLLVLLAVETTRYRRSVNASGGWLKNPLLSSFSLLGLVYQCFSFGVTIPIYWLFYILSGADGAASGTRQHRRVVLTREHAEAILFGIVMGAVVPSFGMLILNDAIVTGMWQVFPMLVSLFKSVHLAVRPPRVQAGAGGDTTGYGLLRVVYLLTAIVASSTHVATVWPRLVLSLTGNNEGGWFGPDSVVGLLVLEFLQWDLTFTYAACIIASFWLVREVVNGVRGVVKVVLWYVLAVPVIGPGAAIAGVVIWREGRLEEEWKSKNGSGCNGTK
ncbi:hypothetical protein AMATHDRAFT_158385 [Amanita thiersii Skay4041]|uniref:Uncharacterized protein n=1 Tax=Amanita thiersii Skay4041 TaxID=703135 RepID=A0A2A9NBK1_9AGAR|nr:hypothetical protein AMATHDRAFT_158385 [Amanita thiersii Skay4041]